MSDRFIGESKHILENGCRLIVPLRFRSFLLPELILYKAPEHCLFIYDREGFKEVAEQLREYAGSIDDRKKYRNAMRAARPITPDKQGRFTIPSDYIEHADLGDTVYLIGMGNKIEVWNEEEYNTMGGSDSFTPDMYPPIRF